MHKFILILSCCAMVHLVWAQEEDPYVYQSDTLGKDKKTKILGLPIVFSTPETGFGFGGAAQVIFLKQPNVYNSRISTMMVSAIYTLNNQLLVEATPQVYFAEGKYFLDMEAGFKVFPNVFWGVGNDTPESAEEDYNMTSATFRALFLKRLPPLLNFGLGIHYMHHDVTEVAEGGLLDRGDITGSDLARVAGMGAVFNFDSRDQIASPRKGFLFSLDTWFSSEIVGATSSFNKFIGDIRTYQPVGKRSTLALQVYSESSFGDVPWQAKAWYGGADRGRGYFRGRFIEDQMYVTQLEYRWRFHRRFSLAGFGTLGGVADTPDNLFDDIKLSYGGGVRFKFVKDQDILLRLDFGFNGEGGSGFYFGVNEAF